MGSEVTSSKKLVTFFEVTTPTLVTVGVTMHTAAEDFTFCAHAQKNLLAIRVPHFHHHPGTFRILYPGTAK